MTLFLLSYIYDPIIKDDMGGYRKIYELAENLEKLGHRAILFQPRFGQFRSEATREAIWIPTPTLPVLRVISFNVLLFFYLLATCRRIKPDIVYSRPINSFTALIFSKLTSSYLVIEVNGDQLQHRRSMGASFIKLFLIKFIERINFRFCDMIIPITHGLKNMLIERYTIPAGKMVVIESGSNTSLFKPLSRADCLEKLKLDQKARYVGFVGMFFRHQGIDTLIEASPAILSSFPDARFLVVGDGVMMEEWKRKISQKNLSQAFIFPGQVPYVDVPLYLNSMDVCVAPFTRDRGETSPLKLFDYLACGRPVVASDIASIHEILLESGAAIPITPDDPKALAKAITELFCNPEKAAELGRRGRQFVQSKYSWEAVAQRLLSALSEDTRRRSPTP